jgi:phage terminase large subunit-like protein
MTITPIIPQWTAESLKQLGRLELLQLLEGFEQQLHRVEYNQLQTWFSTPQIRAAYHKHVAFFEAGAQYDERAIFGGNRTGKTHTACFEGALHLTGLYPDWWVGRRFDRSIDMWAATDTAKNTRDILQEKLCGKPGGAEALGTGMLPRDRIIRTTIKHGTPDAFETVHVRHVSGGVSTLQFKSYDQGRESFQGTRQDLIHLDEEPKMEIYTECAMRLMSTVKGERNGLLMLTETPLLGITQVMQSFMPELRPEPDAMPVSEYEHVDVDEDGNEIFIEE